ncbi:MAG: TonB-dependent receptor [Bacteroidales bacterium]|nr:TonB-dependent receptor [Bacteroidales bacterium]
MKNATIENVLNKIEDESEFYFLFNHKLIDVERKIDIYANNKPIKEILEGIFTDEVIFVVSDRQIVLTHNPKKEFSGKLTGQQQTVTGTVTDASNGEVMPGVNVVVKGTVIGALSDINGRYTIPLSKLDDAILVFSFVGYKTLEVPLANKTTLNVILEPDITGLEEVVVIGYGTQRKETLTGSVASVKGEDINTPNMNVSSSLTGKLPGLIVNQRTGEPGSEDLSILIRGQSSFAATPTGSDVNPNAPLIIIDGVERDNMSRLNPEDIESISVLKDATAAIYGARAANGVIIVTTKKGAIGKPEFTFTSNTSFSSVTQRPKLLGSPEYARVQNEAVWYRANRPNNWTTPTFSEDAIRQFEDGSNPDVYPNTDWYSEIKEPFVIQNRASLQVTGGTEGVKYLLSFGWQDQGSEFKCMNLNYNQYNLRSNVNVNLNKHISVGANISAIISERNGPWENTGTIFTNTWADPTLVARFSTGERGPGRFQESPLLLPDRGWLKISNLPINSTFTSSITIPWVKGLKIDASFNYDLRNQFQKRWVLPYYFYERNPVTGELERKQGTGGEGKGAVEELRDTYNKWTTMMFNVLLSYNTTLNDVHNISAMVGTEKQKNNNNMLQAHRMKFLSTLLPEINLGSDDPINRDNAGSSGHSARDNYMGRLNYDYRKKYLAEFIFRYDGSSNFPKGKQFGFFPAASFGWRISEESFFRNVFPFIDNLKLRYSVGQTGNDRIIPYQYLQLYDFAGSYVFGSSVNDGIRVSTMPNPNVTWEKSLKNDIGFEASLWNSLLGVEVTLFKEHRTDILTTRRMSIPNTLGFSALPPENIGEAEVKGYEIILTHRNAINNDISYSLSANVAYSKSKIIFMDETPESVPWREQTGRPIGAQLVYKTDGTMYQRDPDGGPNAIDPAQGAYHRSNRPGDLRIVNLTAEWGDATDNVINTDDQYRFNYTSTPRMVFGLNSNFTYKGIDLSLFLQGQTGAYNYDGSYVSLGASNRQNSYVTRAEDRWTVDNTTGKMPRSDAYQPGMTDFFMMDATFIRLKTAELGYSIPKDVISRIGLSGFRLYCSGYNLLTWAKEIKHADPELSGGSGNYPPQRVFNLGVNIKF